MQAVIDDFGPSDIEKIGADFDPATRAMYSEGTTELAVYYALVATRTRHAWRARAVVQMGRLERHDAVFAATLPPTGELSKGRNSQRLIALVNLVFGQSFLHR